MHVKKGDNVIVISGKDKGGSGMIAKAFPRRGLVVVEGLNMHSKHQKKRRDDENGQILRFPAPMHVSNVKKKE